MREEATDTGDGGARPSADDVLETARPSWIAAALNGALRGGLAALGGFAVVAVLGLILWAVTPSSGSGPLPILRSAAAAFALANFGSVTIGSAQLTLTPLLLTGLCATALVLMQRRATAGVSSAADEATSVGAGAVAYAVVVGVITAVVAPSGAHELSAVLGALLLSLVCLSVGGLAAGHALRDVVLSRIPTYAVEGLRAGVAAALTTIATAALVLAVALALSFSDATDLASALGGGFGAGLGLVVVCLGYLPNAIGAALGYVTGTGFVVGDGQYSPFGSIPADLPPFPLLAAVPTTLGSSLIALLSLVGLPLAGVVAGWSLVRRLAGRRERLIGVGVAGGVAGVLTGGFSWLSSGGIRGGSWPVIGSVGWQVGVMVAASVLLVAGVWVLAAGAGADVRTAASDADARTTAATRGSSRSGRRRPRAEKVASGAVAVAADAEGADQAGEPDTAADRAADQDEIMDEQPMGDLPAQTDDSPANHGPIDDGATEDDPDPDADADADGDGDDTIDPSAQRD